MQSAATNHSIRQSSTDANNGRQKTTASSEMDNCVRMLDMNNQADMLLATQQELRKCNFRDNDISVHTINQVYAKAAEIRGLQPRSAYELLTRELDGVTIFNTGVEDDEVVEICGSSGSGKTYLCLKMTSLALVQKETAVIYIDTTNYVNEENMRLVLSNFIQDTSGSGKAQQVQQALSRLKVMKVFDLEGLFVFLSMILTQLKRKQLQVDLRLIVIDSLSSLFAGLSTNKQTYYQMVKDLLYYFKTLAKNHFVGIVYTNNTKDASVTRVTDLKNQVGEPLTWAVDKQIFANQMADGLTSYVFLKH